MKVIGASTGRIRSVPGTADFFNGMSGKAREVRPTSLEAQDWFKIASPLKNQQHAGVPTLTQSEASTTFFLPRKSESVTGLPVVDGNVKSGAMSPTFRCVLGGQVCLRWSLSEQSKRATCKNEIRP